jgi:hypothetical protein
MLLISQMNILHVVKAILYRVILFHYKVQNNHTSSCSYRPRIRSSNAILSRSILYISLQSIEQPYFILQLYRPHIRHPPTHKCTHKYTKMARTSHQFVDINSIYFYFRILSHKPETSNKILFRIKFGDLAKTRKETHKMYML